MWRGAAPDPGGEEKGCISTSLPLAPKGVQDDAVLHTPSHGHVLGVHREPQHSSDAYSDAHYNFQAGGDAHIAIRVASADLSDAADWDPAGGKGGRGVAGDGGDGRGLGKMRCSPVPKIQFSSRRKTQMSPGVIPSHCLPCCCG